MAVFMDTDNNTEEVNPNTEKVKITKAQQYTYLTFFCPFCKLTHTLAVFSPGEKVNINFDGTLFAWNESLTKPTISELGSGCIFHKDTHAKAPRDGCHIYKWYVSRRTI